MGSWSFQPVLDSYALVGLLAVVLFALLWLRPTFGRLTPRRQRVLGVLRGLLVLFVVLALLRPSIVLTRSAPQSATIVVLADTSRSMQLPDTKGDKSRWESQLATLQGLEPRLSAMRGDFEVKVYGYDGELRPVPWQQDRLVWPAGPEGRETDLGTSLDQVMRRELGRRLAAVILLGDGVQTAPDPEVEIHEAGRELARLGTSLYAVPFGRAGDEEQSRDVSVENLPEQFTVFVKNELPVRGVIRVRGYVNQELPVELVIEDGRGGQRVVGPKKVTAREDGVQLPVELTYTPDEPGQYKLTLRVPEQPGELVTKNNSLTAFLTVLEGGLKVAYLYGSLVGEQRYLRWSLAASPDIDLRHVFVDPRNRSRWPDDRSELLKDPTLDVILLESIDASAFRAEDLQALAKAVEQGRGLMMIGGYHSFGPGGYFATPLRDVLPVELGRLEKQDPNPLSPLSRDLHLLPEEGVPLVPARPHPITRLADVAENEALWRRLPPLSGANRFRRVKDNAQILAESPQGDPLLVAGEYGRGRCLAFAGDTTRRWWQFGHQSDHKRFWRQVILWLAQREEDQRSDVWVKLPQRRFSPGTAIRFTAGVRSTAGEPVPSARLTAQLVAPGGQPTEVVLSPGGEEWKGELKGLTAPGDYRLEVAAAEGPQPLGSAQAVFQVLDRDIELVNVAADPDQLARLAALTRDVDGRLVAAEQLPKLLDELRSRLPQERIEIERRWRLGDTWWDAWLFFGLIVALLSSEWFLRKRWGLV